MLKIYRSKSHISINVTLPSGQSKHVAFDSLTMGGSVLYTDNTVLQEALEKHPKFGHLFNLEGALKIAPQPEAPKAKVEVKVPITPYEAPTAPEDVNPENIGERAESSVSPTEAPTAKVEVKVACLDDAKEYLAENCKVKRSLLRGRASIVKYAEENNVIFTGI